MTPEARATKFVLAETSVYGSRLFRNNSGGCQDNTGRLIRFGLGNDGSKAHEYLKFGDVLGWTNVKITSEMVGQTLPVFTNIEMKPAGALHKTMQAARYEGSREWCQLRTINLVKRFGGLAGFATCAEDVRNIFNVK